MNIKDIRKAALSALARVLFGAGMMLLCLSSFAQDTITLRSGAVLAGRVIDVSPMTVRYSLPGDDTAVYSIYSNTVHYINYANGASDTIRNAMPVRVEKVGNWPSAGMAYRTTVDPCEFGKRDARTYHNGRLNYFVGAIGILGIAFSAALPAASPPSGVPVSDSIYYSPSYRQCYSKKAKSINLERAAVGYLASRVVMVLLVIALTF